MKKHAKAAILVIGLSSGLCVGAVAEAATLNVPGVGTVSFDQNNISDGGNGSFTGTIQPSGGPAADFSCSYNAVTGQISGASTCGQILNGIGLTNIERALVAARVNAASSLQAETNVRLLDNLVQQRVGANVTVSVAAAGEGAGTGALFGAPTFGSFAFGGGSFLNDNRLGFEKSGHNYVATVGVDHAAGNTLLGGYAGYINTNISLKSLEGKVDSEGWLVGGYVTQVLSRLLSVTASLSYLDSSVDFRRTFTGANVISAYGHNEWTGGLTANALLVANQDYAFSLLGGVTYGAWNDGAYTDSRGITFAKADGDNTYVRGGGVFTFHPTGAFRPYGFATYSRLISDPAYNGRDSLQVGGGVAVGSGRVTGNLEVGTLLLQSGQSETSIGFHLRLAI